MTKPIYLVFDAETGGVDVFEDRIVQWFMATADKDGNILDTWQWFIDPGVPIAEEATAVHGLTNEWLHEHGRDPFEAFNEIRLIFLENIDLIHVAFNMNFDLSILDVEFQRHGITHFFGPYMVSKARLVDGIVIDRHHDKYRKGKRTLAAQADHYGVPYDAENLHDARVDVELTAKVTVKILEKFGIPTTSEQAAWYADWAKGFQEYLRRSDPDAVVGSEWPLKTRETEMTGIETIEGEVTNRSEEGEPYEYFTTITEKEVTGWLRDKVLERVQKSEGVVTSREDSSSYGTCEVCGSYSEDIQIFVDGVEVYSGGDSSSMDTEDYPNPFIKLNEWLDEMKGD